MADIAQNDARDHINAVHQTARATLWAGVLTAIATILAACLAARLAPARADAVLARIAPVDSAETAAKNQELRAKISNLTTNNSQLTQQLNSANGQILELREQNANAAKKLMSAEERLKNADARTLIAQTALKSQRDATRAGTPVTVSAPEVAYGTTNRHSNSSRPCHSQASMALRSLNIKVLNEVETEVFADSDGYKIVISCRPESQGLVIVAGKRGDIGIHKRRTILAKLGRGK